MPYSLLSIARAFSSLRFFAFPRLMLGSLVNALTCKYLKGIVPNTLPPVMHSRRVATLLLTYIDIPFDYLLEEWVEFYVCPSGACGEQVHRVSSPRLHFGRAANYGSTIVPMLDRRVIQVPPVYQCSWFWAFQTDSRSSAKGCTGLDDMKFSRCTSKGMLLTHKGVLENRKINQFQKNIKKYFQIGNLWMLSAMSSNSHWCRSSLYFPFTQEYL